MGFTPYKNTVPFERLAGPYLEGEVNGRFCLGLQTKDYHRDEAGNLDDAAIIAFADFALYALVNHHNDGAYANRCPVDEETIVTLTADITLLGEAKPGDMLHACGNIVSNGKRTIIVQGTIRTERGCAIAAIGGLWARVKVPALVESAGASGNPQSLLPGTGPFRAHLGMGQLPFAATPRHCNDLTIVHGGALLSAAVYAVRDCAEASHISTLHAQFLRPGRAGQLLTVSNMLQKGRGERCYLQGKIQANEETLMLFEVTA
jgi:acyl-coenzyme A thioesterase PaaI-like protein